LELEKLDISFEDLSLLCESAKMLTAINVWCPSELWTNPAEDGWLSFCRVCSSFQSRRTLSFSTERGSFVFRKGAVPPGRASMYETLDRGLQWSWQTLRERIGSLLI
jgi:hypothetical protein